MKFAVVLPDGAADEPTPELGGKTPLDLARTPHLDAIAASGRMGLVRTVPDGFSPGSDVATLSLFGYDPRTDYTGRAPLEAAAQGISTGADALIFRCNLVTIRDGRMHDFTAGHIGQAEADHLISHLNEKLGSDGLRFYSGVSYRNLMIVDPAPAAFMQSVEMRQFPSQPGDSAPLSCTPPHDIPDQPIDAHFPWGAGAEWVRGLMDRAQVLFTDHEVNVARRRRGVSQATGIWLWGQGRPKPLQSFSERFGRDGAVIAAVDLIRGIARAVGMDVLDVPGATGYLDTDYAAKGRAACDALDRYDIVITHIEAPDEAGHQGDAAAKVNAIEEIDRHVVGPLLQKLQSFSEWRILIAPDHPTPVGRRVHTSGLPPFCMAGKNFQRTAPSTRRFTEVDANKTGLRIESGHTLMADFLSEAVGLQLD